MSNTYFEIEKSVETIGLRDYTNNYRLSLTAFVGRENTVQLTVTCSSTIPSQSGTGYIVLSDEDIDNIIAGLLERKLGKISATGDEKSHYCPPKD